jgi:hypothetical protein
LNLTDPKEIEVYRHTLAEGVKIKAIIPLRYVDSLTQEEIRVGALIVDSGKEGVPISGEDFDYLKVIGELIGSAVGKAELSEQLIESYRKKEAMVKQTTDAFRNELQSSERSPDVYHDWPKTLVLPMRPGCFTRKCNCWSPIWRGLRSIQRPEICELKGLVDNP